MRSYRGMSFGTAAVVALIDTVRTPISRMDRAQVLKSQGRVFPRRAPGSWITGGVTDSVTIGHAQAPARDGFAIELRTYRSCSLTAASGVVVYYHGGGWTVGNPPSYDSLCSYLAREVGALVVSVDYRMAPEFTAPYAAHDAIDATRWIGENSGSLGVNTTMMAVSGDSAGGNLAAVVAQQLRDDKIDWIRHQGLIYPATDMTFGSPSISEHARGAVLDRDDMETFRRLYAGSRDGEVISWRDPLVSPLYGKLTGLPPALVQTADLDPIRDDGVRYAEALRAAGVAVRHTNYQKVPHGFASFPGITAAGAQHRWELVSEIRRHLV